MVQGSQYVSQLQADTRTQCNFLATHMSWSTVGASRISSIVVPCFQNPFPKPAIVSDTSNTIQDGIGDCLMWHIYIYTHVCVNIYICILCLGSGGLGVFETLWL